MTTQIPWYAARAAGIVAWGLTRLAVSTMDLVEVATEPAEVTHAPDTTTDAHNARPTGPTA